MRITFTTSSASSLQIFRGGVATSSSWTECAFCFPSSLPFPLPFAILAQVDKTAWKTRCWILSLTLNWFHVRTLFREFVSADPSAGCASHEDSIIQQHGVFYHLDRPMLHRDNTSANPVKCEHACINTSALSEAFCRVVPAGNTLTSSLWTDVVRNYDGMFWQLEKSFFRLVTTSFPGFSASKRISVGCWDLYFLQKN